jgi:hypothetical protein
MYVLRREVMELLAWPLNGRQPAGLAAAPARRGPVPVMPELSPAARTGVFDHFRRVAETSTGDSLLRRQVLYLQSYDKRADAGEWMADQSRRLPRRRSGWTPHWPVARTVAACQVRHGDPAALVDFAEYGLADDAGETANLNYWAYWVGEASGVERDDSFMPARLGPWHGGRMLRHVASRLDSVEGVADLGAHTVRSLFAARPRLAGDDPALTGSLAIAAERALDGGRISPSARRALAEVRYALRMHTS